MPEINRKIILASRPPGVPTADNFELRQTPLTPLDNGQIRVRNHSLSLDSYMRGRVNEAKSYTPSQASWSGWGSGGSQTINAVRPSKEALSADWRP